ncbi:HD domain-containing protein [Fodinisporobacter ferrooxydans]|uniref:HD domain-containing protein n=1 Tax=Fodinisporobacter ferrooxydans TaxID=2901836 RepID=A0ABY4CMZ4_9BACL|nr:HD domain-containing protein [Alicyclobacillaceae bacterium MYW30-H2]
MKSLFFNLLHIFAAIHDMNDEEEIQHLLLNGLENVLTTVRCSIMLLDEAKDELVVTAAKHLPEPYIQKTSRVPNGVGACGYACKYNELKIVSDMRRDPLWKPYLSYSEEAKLRAVWCVPITYKNFTYGTLAFYYDQVAYPSEEDVMLATWLARQIAVAIHHVRLQQQRKQEQMDIISSFVQAVEQRDQYTFGHSQHVAEYSKILGEAIGLSKELLDQLFNGGLLHDIGKILTPDRVLLKPGKLSNEEYEIIKKHPVHGENMIKNIPNLKPYLSIVRHHHERMDGQGYPDGLAGNEIPLLARIVCIADSFDAMTSKRVYRTNMPFELAIRELTRCAGTQFDKDLVDVFVKIIPEKFPDFKRHIVNRSHVSK